MIEFKRGDILTAQAEALVNTVNCVGIMGRGIALQVKNAFPDNYAAYETACRKGELQPGQMLVFDTGQFTNPRYVINFPTKRHWRGKSRLEDIESGLEALVSVVKEHGIRSLAIPPLGCGLGGLDWEDVRPRIEAALATIPDVVAYVFEPAGAPEASRMAKTRKVPKMTAGRAALIGLMHRYLAGLMDPFVTLLEIHKLAYFMQVAGEPLRLSYEKAHYGPYATNLRHVLLHIDGHFISGYGDGSDRPDVQLELVPGAIQDASRLLEQHVNTEQRFERVSDLVEGFETPYGLELLSTVHWIATQDGAADIGDVIDAVHRWGERKRQFSPDQIALAHDVLKAKGWLSQHNLTSID